MDTVLIDIKYWIWHYIIVKWGEEESNEDSLK